MLLLYIFFCHFVADFIVQTRWQAQNKSSSNVALTLHVAMYTLTIAILMLLPAIAMYGLIAGILKLLAWSVLNGVLHFFVDHFTSRASKKAWISGNEKQFWGIVGFDQFLHQACLILSGLLLRFL